MNNSYKTKTIIVSFLLSSLIFLFGCRSQIHRAFNVQDLLISEDTLPNKWAVLEISDDPIVHFAEDNAADMIFYYVVDSEQLTRGGISIYQYNTLAKSISWYEKQERGEFNEKAQAAYYIPDQFEFSSSIADASHFGCHVSDSIFGGEKTICQYLARYEEFVLSFSITTRYGQETITTEELEVLVETIDQHIASFLE